MWGNCILNDTHSHTDKNGLSANNENLKKYNLAINELLKNGFIPLEKVHPFKVKRMNLLIKIIKRIFWIINLFSKNKQKFQKIKLTCIAIAIKYFYNLER